MRTTMFLRLVMALTLATASLACPSDDPAAGVPVDTYFLTDNAIGTWVEDAAMGVAGVEVATDKKAVEGLINGAADPFTTAGFVAFGRQNYTDGSGGDLEVQLWEMNSAAIATKLYTDLEDPASGALHASSTWEVIASLGDAGRVADTGTTYWFSARKGAYYVDVIGVRPHTAPGKAAGEAFIRAIVAKLP